MSRPTRCVSVFKEHIHAEPGSEYNDGQRSISYPTDQITRCSGKIITPEYVHIVNNPIITIKQA